MFINFFEGHNDAEEESDEDEDYVPSEDWKKVCETFSEFQTMFRLQQDLY